MNTLAINKAWLSDFLHESQAIFKFSFPIMFCKVGFMTLGMVDAAMLGELGVNELAGSGVARAIFLPMSVFFMGILFSIDVFSSHALGANRKKDIEKIFFSGMQLAFILSIIFFVFTVFSSKLIWIFGINKEVAISAERYLFHLSFGTPFLIFNLAIQRFLLTQKIIAPFVWIIIISNVLNYYLNKALIFGEYGFTATGIVGAAAATNISRILVFIACIALCAYYFLVVEKNLIRIRNLFSFDRKAMLKMFCFGVPSGGQRVLEVALFSLLTMFSSRLAIAETAAHHVAMLILNFCHNYPVALSSTAAIRIGNFIGKHQDAEAKLAGFCTIFWGTVFMALNAAALFLFPETIMRIFTNDTEVILFGRSIAWMLGLCLILDGLQGSCIGALRGGGENKISFYASIIGYYPVALLLSYALCFWLNLGLLGLWLGLTLGFASVSLLVLSFWTHFKPKLILITSEHEAS